MWAPPSGGCGRSVARSPLAVPGDAIFVPGERRRPTGTLRPAFRLPSSPRDRIQEILGGPRWEGRTEGGGRKGKGAVAAAAAAAVSPLRIRALRGAHPRGVGRGSGAGPDPPQEQAAGGRASRWRRRQLRQRRTRSSGCRVSVREEARHLPWLGCRGRPRGRPGDPAPG